MKNRQQFTSQKVITCSPSSKMDIIWNINQNNSVNNKITAKNLRLFYELLEIEIKREKEKKCSIIKVRIV